MCFPSIQESRYLEKLIQITENRDLKLEEFEMVHEKTTLIPIINKIKILFNL
jgi:hypothetical protein